MSVMSRVERAFCCGALWRTSTGTTVRSLPTEVMGHDVLEIGSGSGAVAEQLAREHPNASVTATDLDPVMVAAATDRLRGVPNAAVHLADATALPFPDASFDSVVSCLMLHHVIDWETTVREATRVLRPGGVFVGYDLVRTPLATVIHRVDRSPFRLFAPDEFKAHCADGGLDLDARTVLRGHVLRFEVRAAA
ncbi:MULTISPECIES: class I SAM-dependent methyltransferase [unclassified Mycolicibacterium]|uniref:class I SAM-dependent methyltransferase n=1 Tax=unclassified Mycolicibacterium TaxID=2636767 RepID=UPI001620CF67|nr:MULTISPECIES: class I SAM-dependent methyltransferase [unclassified Mycolicibacterium]